MMTDEGWRHADLDEVEASLGIRGDDRDDATEVRDFVATLARTDDVSDRCDEHGLVVSRRVGDAANRLLLQNHPEVWVALHYRDRQISKWTRKLTKALRGKR